MQRTQLHEVRSKDRASRVEKKREDGDGGIYVVFWLFRNVTLCEHSRVLALIVRLGMAMGAVCGGSTGQTEIYS